MKFKIRFADQIVGVFTIIALTAIVLVIFLLGSKQRWFVNDPTYKTYFLSASGLGENMSVLHKGFVIGNVKTFKLTENDNVEVVFSIHKDYADRVKNGSLVELNVSPIGLGNQFLFYPGLGEEVVAKGEYIPTVNSAQGQTFIQLGLSSVPAKNDSISNILSQVDTLTNTLNVTLQDVQTALEGTDTTTLGRSLQGVENIIVGLGGQLNQVVDEIPALLVNLQTFTEELDATLQVVNEALTGTDATTLGRALGSVDTTLAKLNDPDGLVASALDTNGPIYTGLTSAIASINGILQDIDATTDILPSQTPAMLMELRALLKKVDDILVAVQNNPIFKNGIPAKVQIQSTGMNSREVTF